MDKAVVFLIVLAVMAFGACALMCTIMLASEYLKSGEDRDNDDAEQEAYLRKWKEKHQAKDCRRRML